MKEKNLNVKGRPRKFKDPKEMGCEIEAYFNYCSESNKPMTVEGLANTLGMDRRSLLNYEKTEGYESFFPIVKRAKTTILQNMVERALSGDNHATMSIFLLKNNFGYRDQQEVAVTDSFEIEF